ncbi:hypothetical protein CQ022_17130 [Chryseobacterium culicis]|uniref:RHS repeat-associated core domain-containing protein n=2 Tax=Chryseobacterium culicis TaxID=680127 RepID=A0A2S9CQ71_CHRCI|nr:hypothetical protein CQ022_17130 [Chryseobacterium culicis]PRB89007.1 hypothetical protein CQ033_16025 [Chryseobacterium culicis]
MGYSANIAGEVKKYTATNSWANDATLSELNENGTYGANQLMKTSTTDSDGNTTTEFKNTDGQTILIRKNDGTQNVDTYYVYNDFGMQVFVITPLAAKTTVDLNALNTLCYQYRYDSLGRLVEKKLPGKDWEYMVYDKADRMILSRDTNIKQNNQWLMTKYDELGRPVYTGFLTGGDRATRQNDLKNLIITEKRSTTGFSRSGTTVYYTENYFSGETPVILSVNYYDTYPQGSPTKPALIFGQEVTGDNMSNSQNTKNLSTASYIKNINDDNWTYNWNWYDAKSRVIGSHTINHLGGYTKTEIKLDFAGTTIQSKVYHKRLQSDPERVISQFFEYDNQNRLLVHKHQIDNNTVEILSQNEYNELSQLKRKKVGGTAPAAPLQSIDYTYNIRGSLIKINDPVNLNGKLFGYGIKYTNPEYSNVGPGKYNGNIAEIDWQNASENIQKRYTYTYDGLNRLKDAVYSEPASTAPFNNYYNEYLTYDLNGNIKTLKRNAFPVTGTTATQVDDLTYDYSGNRLTKVTENALNDAGYEGGNNSITYDLNGNMKDMLDKGIQSISYNFLNLPDTFDIVQNAFGNPINNTLTYLYRADGTKFRKIYTTKTTGRAARTTIQTTDYLDGFQYTIEEGSTCLTCRTTNAYEQQAYKGISELGKVIAPQWKPDFVVTAEGYYSFTENRYIYQYKDHLGNTRVSFAKDSEGAPEIIDTNNYYPFGLNHIGNTFSPFGSFYSYKYNGKELQESGMYDYGARMYMPDLGRWGVTDPLAEAFRRFSPYHYAADNPVMFVDPDGMRSVPYDGGVINHVPEGSFWFAGMNGSFISTPEFKQGSRTGGGSRKGENDNAKGTKPNLFSRIGSFFGKLFGGSKNKNKVEVGPAEEISEEQFSKEISAWQIVSALLFNSTDPYSAIGNSGVGPYAEERENVGMAAMIFINPEAAAEGLERKALSRSAMVTIRGGATNVRIDPQNLPKNVTEDMIEILAGRGNPIIRNGAQETVRHNAKWVGALEWKIKDVPGTSGLNSCRIVQHPDGRWGLVIDHNYTKIIQIPTSTAVKWK